MTLPAVVTATGEVVILFLASCNSLACSSLRLSLPLLSFCFLWCLLEHEDEASDPLSFLAAFFLTAALTASFLQLLEGFLLLLLLARYGQFHVSK